MISTTTDLAIYADLRRLLGELSLISHAPIQGYEFVSPKIGSGKRNRLSDRRPPVPHLGPHRPKGGDTKTPRGTDVEYRPRAPKSPRIEGDARSQKLWDEFEEDLAAWKSCYHRRTVSYFQSRIERAVSEGDLRRICGEIEETIKSWRVMPIPPGQPPALGDAQWKRWVAESREDPGVLATRFSVTRRYINKIRQAWREEAA